MTFSMMNLFGKCVSVVVYARWKKSLSYLVVRIRLLCTFFRIEAHLVVSIQRVFILRIKDFILIICVTFGENT